MEVISCTSLKAYQRAWLVERNRACSSETSCATTISEHITTLKGSRESLLPLLRENADSQNKSIHPDLPKVGFHTIRKAKSRRIESVIIEELATGNIKQSLPINSEVDNGNIYFVDANFDGYLDLSAAKYGTAGPNIPSRYYLYNPKKNAFEEFYELSRVMSAEFDTVNKRITSFQRNGGASYSKYRYRFEGLKLVLEYKETRECTSNEGNPCYAIITDETGEAVRKSIPYNELGSFSQ